MNTIANKKYFIVFIFLLFLFVSPFSLAQQSNKDATPQAQSVEQELIKSNIVVSEWLDSIAEGIDLFLTNKKFSKKPNETRVRIENSSISNESEGVVNSTALNVQLRLPNVEEYFQLKFTSYDEQEERSTRSRYLRQNQRREKYGASLGFFRNIGRIKTAFQPRIQLRDPLKISHSLKFETLIEMTKSSLSPKIEFFADPDKGTGTFNQLNLNIEFTKKYSLTLINEAEYDDKLDIHFSASNGFAINDSINQNMMLSYILLFDSNNFPKYHLDNYDFAIAWNHLLYKKILDYQLIPHLNFPKTNQFKGRAGVTLNVNLNF